MIDNYSDNFKDFQTNILILTPIEVELQAVLAHLQDVKPVEHVDGTIYYFGTFRGKYQEHQIVVRDTGSGVWKMVMDITKAVNLFSPQMVLTVGIAASLKDANIGDVVIGTKAYGYEYGKQFANEFKARPEVENYSFRLIEKAKLVKREGLWPKRVKYQRGRFPDYAPDGAGVFFGPIASGNKVLASRESELVKHIKKVFNDTLAIEMESLAVGALRARQDILTLNIRAISDDMDSKHESDQLGYQELAAGNAAAFTFELIFHLKVYTVLEAQVSKTGAGKLLDHVPESYSGPFIGRRIQLAEFAQMVPEESSPIAITGSKGIGKTVFAQVYVQRFRYQYQNVVWIDIPFGKSLTGSMTADADLIRLLGFNLEGILLTPYQENLLFQKIIEALKKYTGKNLIILNDLNSAQEETLKQFLQLIQNWNVIITTEDPPLPGIRTFELKCLDRRYAVQLFYTHYSLEKNDELVKQMIDWAKVNTALIKKLPRRWQARM